jgi:glyoxylase-like metal-dependent hydrolase (beta-lactamase superfamily II)
MGDYATNCYILDFGEFEVVIDSGVGASNWVRESVKNPKAILLTHGHFDHMWDSYLIAEEFGIKVYIDMGDEPLLQGDFLKIGQPPLNREVVEFIQHNSTVTVEGIDFKFHHLPGHTPGSSLIEVQESYFSGDILFRNSIGRFDFPLSNERDMMNSLEKLLKFNYNYPVYCGHGSETKIEYEINSLKNWIRR